MASTCFGSRPPGRLGNRPWQRPLAPPLRPQATSAKRSTKPQKKASEQQPGSYKEKETDDKIVEIPPKGPDKKPIRGLDS